MHVLLVGNFRLGVTTHIKKIYKQRFVPESTHNKNKMFVEGFRQIINKQKEKSFRRGFDEIKINDR